MVEVIEKHFSSNTMKFGNSNADFSFFHRVSINYATFIVKADGFSRNTNSNPDSSDSSSSMAAVMKQDLFYLFIYFMIYTALFHVNGQSALQNKNQGCIWPANWRNSANF